MIKLREYQAAAIEGVRHAMRAKKKRVLLVAPTGSGKTVMFAHIAQIAASRGNRIVICAHREELIDQISGTLSSFDVPHGFIAAGRKQALGELVTVASIQTLVNRLNLITPQLIILDEAHHATAGSWRNVINAYPQATLLGVTATPERLDGSGLGDIFEAMVQGPQVKELQALGFLTPVKYFGPQTVDPSEIAKRGGEYTTRSAEAAMMPAGDIGKITGKAIDEYRKHADGQPSVVFCVSIEHAKRVAAQFCDAGYKWASIESTMSKEDRRQVVADLRSGALHGVSSCDIISEGFDLPAASVAILLRPTKSLGLYMQQVGRVLRPAPGKTHAIVIDHVCNVGKVVDGKWEQNHGPIELERDWNLDGKARIKVSTIPCKRCPECYALNPIQVRFCTECGHEFVVEKAEPPPSTGVIAEVSQTVMAARDEEWIRSAKYPEVMKWARTEEQLQEVARVRNYWPKWVYITLEGRRKAREGFAASRTRCP